MCACEYVSGVYEYVSGVCEFVSGVYEYVSSVCVRECVSSVCVCERECVSSVCARVCKQCVRVSM